MKSLTMRSIFSIFLLGMCLLATTLSAQEQESEFSRGPKKEYLNAISLIGPTYAKYINFGGVGAGLEYNRMLGKSQNFSFGFAFNFLIWAGTMETGEDFLNGVRANISTRTVVPSINYFPFGSKNAFNLELGAMCQVGSIKRVDTYRPGRFSGLLYDSVEVALFIVPQLHFGITYHFRGKKAFNTTLFGNFGPIIAGETKNKGNYGEMGIKFGGAF